MSHAARSAEIREMIAGRLDAVSTEGLLDHLSTCEVCLAEADRRWSTATLLEVPGPEPPRIRLLERRLMRRLAGADFGGQVAQLATIGLGLVYLGLLEPFFGLGPSADPELDP